MNENFWSPLEHNERLHLFWGAADLLHPIFSGDILQIGCNERCLQALIATVDTIDAFILLQNMAPLSYDSSRLVDVACIAFATVDKEHMGQLRSSFEGDVNARIQVQIASLGITVAQKFWSCFRDSELEVLMPYCPTMQSKHQYPNPQF